ncbi:MAG: hypothetical protein JWN25_1269 [Verrucomicrobiales bacterium]|jgi:hypothetical protein|nr:hypothetical protein [Verrucomicrobiales bacterium]
MLARSPSTVCSGCEAELLLQVLNKELKHGGEIHLYADSALFRTVKEFEFAHRVHFRKCRNHVRCFVLHRIARKTRTVSVKDKISA